MNTVSAPEWEQMYSVKEVSGIFKVDRETIRRWVLDGHIRVIELPCKSSTRNRIYISRRITRSELERFIRVRTTELNERKRRRAA